MNKPIETIEQIKEKFEEKFMFEAFLPSDGVKVWNFFLPYLTAGSKEHVKDTLTPNTTTGSKK